MTTQTSTWHGEPPSDRDQGVPRAVPGTVIGKRYQLRAAIGNGGMGTVWQASDTLLHRDVAVKEVLLPPGMARGDRDAMCERTLREARAAAALSHPSVVQVFDVVTEGGRPWIVMELLHARSLADIIISDGPLAPRVVAKIGIALLGALEVAHAAGVLHRDVKPANVLICTDGRCVLTDFGVARVPAESNLTTPGMVLGSPHFISPERAVGSAFGPPSDLFSLGVSLYTAIEGRPPFDKGDPFETMRAVVEDQPAPPVRAGALSNVLYGLLEKDPARRWDVATARPALRSLLSGALANRAIQHVTDPYAVMQNPPAPTWAPQQASGPPPVITGNRIGGRAMIAPGESLADRVGGPAAGADAAGGTGPAERGQAADQAAGATPFAPPRQGYSGRRRREGAEEPVPPGQPTMVGSLAGMNPATTQAPHDGGSGATATRPIYHPGAAPAGAAPTGFVGPVAPGAHFGGAATQQWTGGPVAGAGSAGTQYGRGAGAAGGIARGGGRVAGAIRRWPRWMRIAVAVAAMLLLILVPTVLMRSHHSATPKVGPSAIVTTGPHIPVQLFEGEHVTVNVPAGWKRQPPKSGSYMDFVEDPAVATAQRRWVRVDVYAAPANTTARSILDSAANRFRSGQGCAAYQLVGMRDADLAGQHGTEFEYQCGTPATGVRHGIWRVIVANGLAYGITLSVPDSQFGASKPIFDEMARSLTVKS